MRVQSRPHADDVNRSLMLWEQSLIETMVSQAVELVESEDMGSFEAVDIITIHYGYSDFELVLRRVRSELEQSGGDHW